MRSQNLIAWIITILMLFSLFASNVKAQDSTILYKIKINTDGSVVWIVTQVQDINGTIDTWEAFQQKIVDIISSASNTTGRSMYLDLNSVQMGSTISQETQSKNTEYTFVWMNFSIPKNGELSLGDVFVLPGFFSRLYGEGTLELLFPSMSIKSVSPAPNLRDDASKTLEWLRTQDFIVGKPNIVFDTTEALETPDQGSTGSSFAQYEFVVFGLVTTCAALIAAFFFYRYRKNSSETVPLRIQPQLETEEEKVIRVIVNNGGTISQSSINDQCKFSKAKTSQLLTALEKKDVVRRYKKGRDKIVTLVKQGKGE
jgi:uncharacterized membrane protein